MNKLFLGIAAIAVLLGSVLFYEHSKVSADDLPSCIAGENEICAPKRWMDTLDHANKMSQALQAGVPGGYSYNGQGKFIKNVTRVEPAPPIKK